jgi:CheY-like chemotaxis protein
LQSTLQAALELAELTQRVQSFSRNQVLHAGVHELNELVRRWLAENPRPPGDRVEVKVHFSPEAVLVKADARGLRQVLGTLAKNAADAMPTGGQIHVETAGAPLDEASGVALPAGEYARLSVSDGGPGIVPEVRARIFDPFFTTRSRSEASGLGLAAAYGIVKQSGGEIWAYSEPDKGTSFKVFLPRVDEGGNPWMPRRAGERETGSETLLLVEDDQVFREALREALVAAGYQVLDAGHAGEALRLAECHAGPIQAAISDVVLPGMDGPALLAILRGLRPELRALLMSGFPERAGERPLPAPLIEKPFTGATLLRRVRELLDAPG